MLYGWQESICSKSFIKDTDGVLFLSDENDLVSGYMGIMEPSDICDKAKIRDGLFIMPGLAFDYDFHRIGYGGGFYDRYLRKIIHL